MKKHPTRAPTRWPLATLALGASLLGCSETAPPKGPGDTRARVVNLRTRDVLPLADRTVAAFRVRAGAEEGTFVLEYYRPSPAVAHLVIAGRTERLTVSETDVRKGDGGILLGDPLEVGRTFRGSFGDVTITAVDVPVTVPAGSYERCVTTREASRVAPKIAESTYCEGVGLVRLIVEAGADHLENELTSYGPRVDLGTSP